VFSKGKGWDELYASVPEEDVHHRSFARVRLLYWALECTLGRAVRATVHADNDATSATFLGL